MSAYKLGIVVDIARAHSGMYSGHWRSITLYRQAQGGTDDEDNLWLACRMCNGFKSDHTHGTDPLTGKEIRLFNPRKQQWPEHFSWSEDGTQIVGLTDCGRATVVVLQLNNVIAVMVRHEWVDAGWHPPH